jgi:hypothetical protein
MRIRPAHALMRRCGLIRNVERTKCGHKQVAALGIQTTESYGETPYLQFANCLAASGS